MACSRLARRPRVSDRDSLPCAWNVEGGRTVGGKREEDRRQRHTENRSLELSAALSVAPSVESRQRRRDVREERKKKEKKNRKSVRQPREDASSDVGGICEVRATVSSRAAPRYATNLLN